MTNQSSKNRTPEIKILAIHAVQKLDTSKPRTSVDTSKIMQALITSRNAPKVSIVKGMVNQKIIGLTIALANPSSNAEKIRERAVVNLKPGSKQLTTQSEPAVMPQWITKGGRSIRIPIVSLVVDCAFGFAR